jgi:hypothetical protein
MPDGEVDGLGELPGDLTGDGVLDLGVEVEGAVGTPPLMTESSARTWG